MASHVRDYTAWEVIPPPAVDEACRLAKDEAALAVEQDCTVVWSSPARSSLEPPRLRLTAAAHERVRKHSNAMAYSSQVVMPEVIGNKRAGPALRDGTVLCPQWNQGLCINGDACPVAHRCAAVYRSGRVCGGHHPALECRSPKVQWVNVHTTPQPPARKRGGTAEKVTPKHVRRGQEPAAGRGPEPEEARPSHREPASPSHRGLVAADEEFVDVLVEDEPPVPMTPPPRARVLPLAKTGPRGPARAVEPVPLPVVDPQAEADLALRCSTAWLGAGQLRGQPLCFERNPEAPSSSPAYLCRNSATFMGRWRSPEDLARDWGEVFGIIARTLWHGDCVVVHCMAGRHRAALLVCVTLALLRGTSLAATETWMLTRRQIELNEVR